MTPKQQEVFAFICDTLQEKRYSPSYEEIMAYTGHKSKANIFRLVNGLIERGYLMREWAKGGSRNIILTPLGRTTNKREVCPHCQGEL